MDYKNRANRKKRIVRANWFGWLATGGVLGILTTIVCGAVLAPLDSELKKYTILGMLFTFLAMTFISWGMYMTELAIVRKFKNVLVRERKADLYLKYKEKIYEHKFSKKEAKVYVNAMCGSNLFPIALGMFLQEFKSEFDVTKYL